MTNRAYWKEHQQVDVGIMNACEICFDLCGDFIISGIDGNKTVTGSQHVCLQQDGLLLWQGKSFSSLEFKPTDGALFRLHKVTIGVAFHWQRQLSQTFRGSLILIPQDTGIQVVNRVHIEDYLESVISSEMKATASLEFLKASAIISRSWLLKQIENRINPMPQSNAGRCDTAERLITWSDRADHKDFDVCADDHCQRYQGADMACNRKVAEAMRETYGQVLCYGDDICDARFAKCCGGLTEEYATCWEDAQVPYLTNLRDLLPKAETTQRPETEQEWAQWFDACPDAFCNTNDTEVLSQVLNDYDLETRDFYRWTVAYSQEEMQQLLQSRLGIDFGDIIDLVPLKRGASGRIHELHIIGSNHQKTIGKELLIRKALSTSHLYSSAFVVERSSIVNGVPQSFVLHGAGWGHGVGMCQIGAAVMGQRGYSATDILLHYYKDANIIKLY